MAENFPGTWRYREPDRHISWCKQRVYTVEDKKRFPFGISRTMLLRGVSLTFYVNGRLKTVIERS